MLKKKKKKRLWLASWEEVKKSTQNPEASQTFVPSICNWSIWELEDELPLPKTITQIKIHDTL